MHSKGRQLVLTTRCPARHSGRSRNPEAAAANAVAICIFLYHAKNDASLSSIANRNSKLRVSTMAKTPAKNKDSSANLGFEAKLWLTADKLRNNMDAACM